MRELVLRAPNLHRRVRLGFPKGWTGERESDGRSWRLYGPEGEGKIVVAAALHPSELTRYLDEMRSAHPAAAPSPPMPMTLPGIDPQRGERATRFQITGREVGEMVLLERQDTIVLIVTVVDPAAWPNLAPMMARVYPTLEILNVP